MKGIAVLDLIAETPPPPCVDCTKLAECKADRKACLAFRKYITSGEGWEGYERIPSAKIFAAIYAGSRGIKSAKSDAAEEERREKMRLQRIADGISPKGLARKFGVSDGVIDRILYEGSNASGSLTPHEVALVRALHEEYKALRGVVSSRYGRPRSNACAA